MNNEVNDQADQLKRIFAEVEQHEDDSNNNLKQQLIEVNRESNPPTPKIDVLNLPPRRDIHSNEKSRARLKIRLPFLRLVLVILFMIIVVSGAYIFFGEELMAIIKRI